MSGAICLGVRGRLKIGGEALQRIGRHAPGRANEAPHPPIAVRDNFNQSPCLSPKPCSLEAIERALAASSLLANEPRWTRLPSSRM